MDIWDVASIIIIGAAVTGGASLVWQYAPPGLRKWMLLAYVFVATVALAAIARFNHRRKPTPPPQKTTPELLPPMPSKDAQKAVKEQRDEIVNELKDIKDAQKTIDMDSGEPDPVLSELAMRDR